MSDRPVFIDAATYAEVADAFADYDSLLEPHAEKLLGGLFDVNLAVEKEIDADSAEFRRELEEAEKQAAAS